jgi:hypothetical protein
VTTGATFGRGLARPLFEGVPVLSVQPSADGQRFLARVPTDGNDVSVPITVVTNWKTALKQ